MSRLYSPNQPLAGSTPKRPATGFSGGPKGGGTEKPAFPGADLPGKTQGRDRSAGVPRVKTSPKTVGL